MACAFAADHTILNRGPGVNRDFVWLNLHKIEDASVARLLSTQAKKHLPVNMPADVKATYTTKMWRRGGITLLSNYDGITNSNACARSGHKLFGNHFETYVCNTGIGLSLPAGMALNDYQLCRGVIPIPVTFNLLPQEDYPGMAVISTLVSEFLPSNLPEFMPSGRLFKVLEIMTATVIMPYNSMIQEFGAQDTVVHKLGTIFRSDSNLNLTMLWKWSSQILWQGLE